MGLLGRSLRRSLDPGPSLHRAKRPDSVELPNANRGEEVQHRDDRGIEDECVRARV